MNIKSIRLRPIASRPPRTKHHSQTTFRINAKKPYFTEFVDPTQIPPSLLPSTYDGNNNGPPRNNSNHPPVDNDDHHRNNNHQRRLLTFFLTGCIGGSITKLITDSVNQFNNILSASISQETPIAKGKVAIVIPMLNEASCITDLITYLKTSLTPPPSIIICVDGGSTDDSVKLAKKAGARVTKSSKKGRASQMNQGVAASLRCSPDYFMFLHADSYPPQNSVKIIKNILSSQPDIVLGGFFTSIEHQGKQLKLLTLNNYLSTYYGPLVFRPTAFFKGLRLLFGDQTLFCRKDDFTRVGMFDDRLKLMEDADLCVRMNEMGSWGGKRGQGRVVQLPPHVGGVNKTSGRRLASWGNIKSTGIHLAFCLKYAFGASPEEIGRMYDKLYGDAYR